MTDHTNTPPATSADPASTRYEIDDKTNEQINRAFTYHAPKSDQPDRYTALRRLAKSLAYEIAMFVPPGRERALAMTKLEEAVMWANAGIARGE